MVRKESVLDSGVVIFQSVFIESVQSSVLIIVDRRNLQLLCSVLGFPIVCKRQSFRLRDECIVDRCIVVVHGATLNHGRHLIDSENWSSSDV